MLGPAEDGLEDDLLTGHVDVVTGQELADLVTRQQDKLLAVHHLHEPVLGGGGGRRTEGNTGEKSNLGRQNTGWLSLVCVLSNSGLGKIKKNPASFRSLSRKGY